MRTALIATQLRADARTYRRRGWSVRLRARLRAGRYDHDLDSGNTTSADDAMALHAARIVTPGERERLAAALADGAQYADLRLHRIVNEIIQVRDGELETAVTHTQVGLAVRVIVDGTWGFASHAELSVDVAAATARRAVEVANTLAALNAEAIELADEPVYAGVQWVSSYGIDPFVIPTGDKIAVLGEYSERLLAADGVDHVRPGVGLDRARCDGRRGRGECREGPVGVARSGSGGMTCCTTWLMLAPVGVSSAHVVAS